MKKQRIILDVTEFNSWSGHLTGIQRVVYGLASALSDESVENIVCVSFDQGRHLFIESDTKSFFSKVNEAMQTEPTHGDFTDGLKHELKNYAKKVYRRSPQLLKTYLTDSRKQTLKRIANKTLNTLNTVRSKKVVVPHTHDQIGVIFREGDVFISAGRAWDDEVYLDQLIEYRQTHGLVLAFVVYDLIPIYKQHTFGPGLTERFTQYLFKILQNGDYLLPISLSTKADLVKFSEEIGIINNPTIQTIHLGDDIEETGITTKPAFVDSSRFALNVGTIEARKNHAELYYAYKLAFQEKVELPTLYIVGKPGWLTGDIIYFITHDTDINNKIRIISDVTDNELTWLYKNALFTVFPSQYEGWGLPVAESIALGTPCISSNVSSMPEIEPHLVDYVSPYDSRELLDKMIYYSVPEHSDKKRKEIIDSYKPYSWRKTASNVLKVVSAISTE